MAMMITARTSVNIAVIKYWGKKDETLIIPINDSISGTLDSDDLCTTTTVAVSPSFSDDRMWLNGQEVVISENKRLVQCLSSMRSKVASSRGGLRICSFNNFPTAAGLASSAAGYACLVYALGNLFGITDKEELSVMARMGSGSAIRSLEGGFVQWIAGQDSNTSIAKQIVNEDHWPEMRVLILVVNDHQKETGSTEGMKRSVQTSDLIHFRAETVVPKRVKDIKKAIIDKDFATFAKITMKDSNQFHAIAQDTYPPIRYMTDLSWDIIDLVHKFNHVWGTTAAAYTFDAGPNACIYILDTAVSSFLAAIVGDDQDVLLHKLKGKLCLHKTVTLQSEMKHLSKAKIGSRLKYILHTKIGKGAEVLQEGPHLLNAEGLPTQ